MAVKVHVHDTGEGLLHDVVHNLSQFGQVEIPVLLGHIPAGDDGGDGGRVGAGPPDPQLLQSLYQGRLGVMGRRLGEMLLRSRSLSRVSSMPFSRPPRSMFFSSFSSSCLCIYRAEPLKQDPGRRHRKPVVARRDPHGGRLISGRLHPAGHKPLPDQLVEAELVSGQESPSSGPVCGSRPWGGWPRGRPGCSVPFPPRCRLPARQILCP